MNKKQLLDRFTQELRIDIQIQVDASPMSRPILEKKGFQFLSCSYPCMMTD
ncbi:hypothetical protein [Brevibacillus sp. H7]|uniref:hypothetical protein n=1 Tax=Brevibacillus sp. H7 TaxID=3349138 RepID=UPI003808E67D